MLVSHVGFQGLTKFGHIWQALALEQTPMRGALWLFGLWGRRQVKWRSDCPFCLWAWGAAHWLICLKNGSEFADQGKHCADLPMARKRGVFLAPQMATQNCDSLPNVTVDQMSSSLFPSHSEASLTFLAGNSFSALSFHPLSPGAREMS